MLPNRFPDDGSAPTEDDYNNADGTVRHLALHIKRSLSHGIMLSSV